MDVGCFEYSLQLLTLSDNIETSTNDEESESVAPDNNIGHSTPTRALYTFNMEAVNMTWLHKALDTWERLLSHQNFSSVNMKSILPSVFVCASILKALGKVRKNCWYPFKILVWSSEKYLPNDYFTLVVKL